MKYTSVYRQKSFKHKIIPLYIWSTIIVGPLLVLCFMERPEGVQAKGLFRIIEILQHITLTELLDVMVWGIPVSMVATGIMYKIHDAKRIIVQVEFKEKENEIEVISRKITSSKLERKSLFYKDVLLKEVTKVYDGMSMGSYRGFEMESNLEHVGYLLYDHFVWTNTEVDEIITAIKKKKV